MFLIKFIFFCRDPALICFSLAIASRGLLNISYQINLLILYFLVKPSTNLFLCSTLFRKLLVIPSCVENSIYLIGHYVDVILFPFHRDCRARLTARSQ